MESRRQIRRQPPPYVAAAVVDKEQLTSWLLRLHLEGPGVAAMEPADPAASVRVLLPDPGGLSLPVWSGNEFLRPDGTRPVIRTLTPGVRIGDRLALDVVVHEGGALSDWAVTAGKGSQAALSGPGRGSAPAPGASRYLLAGDGAAVPAVAQLLEAMPAADRIDVFIETAHPDEPLPLPGRPDASVTWLPFEPGNPPGSALVAAVSSRPLDGDLRVWAAGEAAAMQRIRRHLADGGFPRPHSTVRGYWKHGKAAGAAPA